MARGPPLPRRPRPRRAPLALILALIAAACEARKDREPDAFERPPGAAALYPPLASALRAAASGVLACGLSTSACGATGEGMDWGPGSLGRCAFVASGKGLLKSWLGAEIDGHDTVVRIGYGPVAGFEPHVGSRTDVVFARPPAGLERTTPPQEMLERDRTGFPLQRELVPRKFFLTYPDRCVPPAHRGVPVLKLKCLSHKSENERPAGGCDGVDGGAYEGWFQKSVPDPAEMAAVARELQAPLMRWRRVGPETKDKERDSPMLTHGLELVLSLLGSGLCESLDVYGFSEAPTEHYFAGAKVPGSRGKRYEKRRVRPGHTMAMEFFLLESLQETGGVGGTGVKLFSSRA